MQRGWLRMWMQSYQCWACSSYAVFTSIPWKYTVFLDFPCYSVQWRYVINSLAVILVLFYSVLNSQTMCPLRFGSEIKKVIYLNLRTKLVYSFYYLKVKLLSRLRKKPSLTNWDQSQFPGDHLLFLVNAISEYIQYHSYRTVYIAFKSKNRWHLGEKNSQLADPLTIQCSVPLRLFDLEESRSGHIPETVKDLLHDVYQTQHNSETPGEYIWLLSFVMGAWFPYNEWVF